VTLTTVPSIKAIPEAGIQGRAAGATGTAAPPARITPSPYGCLSPVHALTATGASGFQAFLFGRLPQAMNGFASLTLYQWECNIRSATILGFVGAGGIGQQILISMNLFDYPKVATIVVVLLVDRFSAAIRRRLAY
jgi:hypothetical protein